MMYFVLFAATLAATGKSVFMKKIGVGSGSARQLIGQNALSFAVAGLVSLIIIRFDFLKIINISGFSLCMSFLFALSVIFTYLTQMKAMALGNSSSTMLIYSCGFLIPIIFGVIALKEKISLLQFLGLLLLIPSLYFIINPKGKGKFSVKWLVFSVLSMTGSGITAVLQKIHQNSSYRDEFLSLLSLEFIFASTILVLVVLFIPRKKNESKTAPKTVAVSSANGVFIGILNTLNLRLAGKLPSVIVFPVYNIGSLVLSGVILSLMFGEKTSIKEKAGLVLGVAGIMLIGIG